MHPDNRYIEGLKRNDSALIEAIYKHHAAKIERLVLANNGNADDAADLFQEALTDLYKKAHNGFVLTCPLDAFLYMVCRNKWINVLNKKKRTPVTFTDTLGYSAGEDVFASQEHLQKLELRHEIVAEQLEQLGEGCRKLLELCQTARPLEEIARLLDTSYGYVRKKKSECMARLVALVKASVKFKSLMD